MLESTVATSAKFVRQITMGCCIVALSAACNDSPTQVAEEPPALPEAAFDQVGLPADYATRFSPLYVFDRPDNRQVRVVLTNNPNVTGPPFPDGTILVMETYRAKADAQGALMLGADGRFQRDALAGIFVMRKEKFFGLRYKEHQTGAWEYASFRTDKTPNVGATQLRRPAPSVIWTRGLRATGSTGPTSDLPVLAERYRKRPLTSPPTRRS